MITAASLLEDMSLIIEGEKGYVYHGSNSPNPNFRDRRVTADFQSMGTWFSSSERYAKMFGKNIHKLPIPKGKFYRPKNHRFATVFFDREVARKLYGERPSEILAKYQKAWPNSPRRARNWTEEDDEFVDEKMVDFLKNLGIYYKGTTSGPEPFRQLIYSNADYVQLLKWKFEAKYNGILFKNSKIDIPETHDVYLIFEPHKVKNWRDLG